MRVPQGLGLHSMSQPIQVLGVSPWVKRQAMTLWARPSVRLPDPAADIIAPRATAEPFYPRRQLCEPMQPTPEHIDEGRSIPQAPVLPRLAPEDYADVNGPAFGALGVAPALALQGFH